MARLHSAIASANRRSNEYTQTRKVCASALGSSASTPDTGESRPRDRPPAGTGKHARIALARDSGHSHKKLTLTAFALPPRSFRRLPLLCVAAALALGWGLSSWRLLDPDEGRNAEVAREMALSHDYLVPHLDGLPYLDKPIVYFAAAAVTMAVFGPSEAAARLPAYLSTLATLVLLVAFARRRWGRDAGWLAGLAFVTMPLVLAYARETIFDATLTFFITAAILALVEERPALD